MVFCCAFKNSLQLKKHCVVHWCCQNHASARVRFAPSPTGLLHIGGLRTALYNYLFAKSHKNGKFIIRVEDTDQTRIVPGAIEHMLSTLDWTGIVPDESPMHGGSYGPYTQSCRLALYSEHSHKLVENGLAYRCFCSPLRLSLLKRDQKKRREQPKYDNRCRHLSADQVEENLSKNVPYVIRLKINVKSTEFSDEIFGNVKHDVGLEGDTVLLKSDGFPTYHLANVVDDHLMEITHVIRGREWLISTPKHILLYEAFGWQPPSFMHLPLLVNKDGTKLSKRQEAINVEYYKEHGYSPSAIINFMVYCGSGFKDTHFPVITSDTQSLLQNLSSSFYPRKLLQSDAIVDLNKLDDFSCSLTTHAIENGGKRKEMINTIFDLVLSKYDEACLFYVGEFRPTDIRSYIASILDNRKNHIITVNDLVSDKYEFLWLRPEYCIDVLPSYFASILPYIITYFEGIDWKSINQSDFGKYFRHFAKSEDVRYSEMMKSLRYCLSGKEEGPAILDVTLMLGKKELLWRLSRAQDQLLIKPETLKEN